MVEHHRRGEQQGRGIGETLAGDVRRRAVDCLEDGGVFANVGARRHSETAHQSGDFVGQDIAEQVGRDDHVELPRVEHQLHGAGVNDALVHLDLPAILLRMQLARDLEKDAGERLHDVCLVHHRNLLARLADGVLEGVLQNTSAAGASVHTRTDGDRMGIAVDRDVVFETDIQALEVLAHHDQIDVVVASARDQRLGRPHIGVELELLPQTHVRRAETPADRGFQRTLERQLGAAHTRQRRFR